MALTYRSPLEENFASYDSSVQAAIASTSATYYKELEQENFRFFNFYVRPEAKKHLIDAGIYISPNAAVPHSHPACKTLENHLLYITLPPLIDNSFFFVGIKDSKVNMLKTRDSSLTMINKLNRYVTSLDRVRYGPEFVISRTKVVAGMERHQPLLAGSSLKDLVPPLMERSAKRLFLHDELHYWGHKDLITFLEVLKPEIIYATFVFPPEVIAGARASLNKWCYTFELVGKDLLFYPDGVRTEGYQQPLHCGYLLKTRRLILNDGSYYNVDIVQSKFAHHLISISRGKESGPTIRAFGPFQATSCKGLEPLTRNVNHCFPIPFEVVSRVYRYLRTLKKPDAQSAMAKLSQLLPEPGGEEIKFLQDFADLVINTKTVHTMIQVDHLTLFFTKWLKKLPGVLAAKFKSVQSLSLDEFITMLEPYTFHVTLIDVEWSYNSILDALSAEAESEVDLVNLIDGRFRFGGIPEFAGRTPAPYTSIKGQFPCSFYAQGVEIGPGILKKYITAVIIQEVLSPCLRAVSRQGIVNLILRKVNASRSLLLPRGKVIALLSDAGWFGGCLAAALSLTRLKMRTCYFDDHILWLLSADRHYTPLITNQPDGRGFFREAACLWAEVLGEVITFRPKLVKRSVPLEYQTYEKPPKTIPADIPVAPSRDNSSSPPKAQVPATMQLSCQCGIALEINSMLCPNEHGFQCPDQLKGRRAGWYSQSGCGYKYNGGSHENLGWPEWLPVWMELNGVDVGYYNCCLYQVYEQNASIGFHRDDEGLFEADCKIMTCNLKGEATFKVQCCKGGGQVLLSDGVQFTMPEGFQGSHKHSVVCTSAGRASVTFRRLAIKEPTAEQADVSGSGSSEGEECVSNLLLGVVKYEELPTGVKCTKIDVPGDGSCFWHSLEVHTGLKAMEIKKLCRNVFYPEEAMQRELTRQLGDGVYAEELAIMAAAHVLRATIIIHNQSTRLQARFQPLIETQSLMYIDLENEHFRPMLLENGCLVTAIAAGLDRRECDVLRVIDEQSGVGLGELWSGQGVNIENLAFYFNIFDICAHVNLGTESRILNEVGRFPLNFSIRDQHIEFVGKNPQANVEINLGMQKGLATTESSMLYIKTIGSAFHYTATKERAAILANCLEFGGTGVISSKLFNDVDNFVKPSHPEEREIPITGILGTFGAGKSSIFRKFFDLNEGKCIFYISPRRALADEFKDKLQMKTKSGRLRSKHWKIITFELFLKQIHLVKAGMTVILDEIQLYPPGYLDLVGIMLAENVNLIIGGDPCQSEYDNEKDRIWLSAIQKDLERLLDGAAYKYNILSRRFNNANFIGRLPCEFPLELRNGKAEEHYILDSLEELKAVGGRYCKTFLVSSFEEKKIVETHFFDFEPKVLTFGEATGLNFKKGTILVTNISQYTSERRWVTAVSRFSQNICFVNLTGTSWQNVVTTFKDRVLARFLSKTACHEDLRSMILGKPRFTEGFDDRVGRNEGMKEEKVQGDPWLKGMLDLFQLEDVEEEEMLLEECEEEWFKTHLPQAELEGVRARWVHKILAKEFREVRMGYNVSEQFTDEYAKEDGKILTNAAERFETIYPRHRANDTVTFLMAVKKRLRFSRPAIEKAKLIEAQMYGKFLLEEFLKKIPLKGHHDVDLMAKARRDFEEKKVSKSAATIENHAGRSCRDWLIDIGLIFSKSQLCTKFDNRFRVAKAAQSIVCFQHAVLCRFAPYMRYIEMKLHQALPENYYIHSGKGLEELNAWVKKGGFSGICTESDYEAFDASQDQYMVAFEVEVMKYLGLPMDLIEDYKFIKTHLGSKLGNFAIMRFSGEASTFLFNTMANMLFTFLRYEVKGNEYICFAGDDMCASERLATKNKHSGFLSKLKLKAKVFMVDKPTFCGWHLSPDGIYKKPQLVMERMCIAKEKNNLANCIDNYAIEVSFAYRLGERALNRMDEEEAEAFYNCVRIIVKNKHLLKSDIAKLYSRALEN
uniref:RdRp n=1 Tax=Tagetes carlavirus 1 TaxID=2794422 RepID=A0A7T5QZ60_9VIRU|nr:RdRp [Tagetes carlavirus 1]